MSLSLLLAVALFLAYLALTANLQPANLVVGVVLGAMAAALLRPRGPALPWRRIPGALAGLAGYLGYLAIDILKCGIAVARIVLDPRLPIRPGVVAVRSHMREWGTALSAHAITITPGEMVLAIDDDGTMYVHCLDAEASGASADGAQANRRALLTRVFPEVDE